MSGPTVPPAAGAPPGHAPSAAELSLAQTYRQVLWCIDQRASWGDPTARRFAAALTGYAHPRPPRALVFGWLADVASERGIIRGAYGPGYADRLLADIHAREARVPGTQDAVWNAIVDAARAGQR